MSKSRSRGFTLVELMVALLMGSILMMIAIPGFNGLLRDVRLSTQSNRLITALNLARTEAAKGIPGKSSTTRVTVCKADTTASPPTCDSSDCQDDGSHCWEKGWLVFRDPNSNGSLNDKAETDFCGTSKDCTLAVFPAMPKEFTLRTGKNLAQWIAFEPDGSAVSGNGLTDDTFRLCQGDDTANARSVVVRSGRIRSEKGADSCP